MGKLVLITAITIVLLNLLQGATALWCYRCVGTHPGCGEDFDWRWYWSWYCPEPDDKCVKLVERKDASTLITRDCLSNLRVHRHDIPADTYEGCRNASVDVRLAHYVFNDIKEMDIRRNYYDQVTWCFCDFDERCNGARSLTAQAVFITFAFVTVYYLQRRDFM